MNPETSECVHMGISEWVNEWSCECVRPSECEFDIDMEEQSQDLPLFGGDINGMDKDTVHGSIVARLKLAFDWFKQTAGTCRQPAWHC